MANGLNKWGEWDGIAYCENRSQIDPETLREYLGQWLAWDLAGTKVVAHHEDAQEVFRQVRAKGLDPDRVVLEHLLVLYADEIIGHDVLSRGLCC